MNFYKRKQKWKYVLFLVAILISTLSIYLIGDLEKELEKSINSLSQSIETLKQNEVTLKTEESSNMKNFAKAMQHLNNMSPNTEGDYSFSMEIIKQNVNIPLILIDECHDILQYRNIEIPEDIESNQEKKKQYVLAELEIMKKVGDSIFIDVWGEKQKLYYKNSAILDQTKSMHNFTLEKQQLADKILKKMRWYPRYQLAFIFLFAILAGIYFFSF